MIRIRQILRLHTQGYSKLKIAVQTSISHNTLKKYLKEFTASGLSFDEVNELSDKDLEDFFVKQEDEPINKKLQALFNRLSTIEKELKKKGVTPHLLWEQYRREEPEGYSLTQFKHYYTQWKAQVNPVMRMEHKAGDKLYVDFAGDKLHITDLVTGEMKPVEVFVAILGASQLTYAEAVMTQQKEDFIAACENALHFSYKVR